MKRNTEPTDESTGSSTNPPRKRAFCPPLAPRVLTGQEGKPALASLKPAEPNCTDSGIRLPSGQPVMSVQARLAFRPPQHIHNVHRSYGCLKPCAITVKGSAHASVRQPDEPKSQPRPPAPAFKASGLRRPALAVKPMEPTSVAATTVPQGSHERFVDAGLLTPTSEAAGSRSSAPETVGCASDTTPSPLPGGPATQHTGSAPSGLSTSCCEPNSSLQIEDSGPSEPREGPRLDCGAAAPGAVQQQQQQQQQQAAELQLGVSVKVMACSSSHSPYEPHPSHSEPAPSNNKVLDGSEPHLSPSPFPCQEPVYARSPDAPVPVNLSVVLEQVSAVEWPGPPPSAQPEQHEFKQGRGGGELGSQVLPGTAAPLTTPAVPFLSPPGCAGIVQRLSTVLSLAANRAERPAAEASPFTLLMGALQAIRLQVLLPSPAEAAMPLATSLAVRAVQLQLRPAHVPAVEVSGASAWSARSCTAPALLLRARYRTCQYFHRLSRVSEKRIDDHGSHVGSARGPELAAEAPIGCCEGSGCKNGNLGAEDRAENKVSEAATLRIAHIQGIGSATQAMQCDTEIEATSNLNFGTPAQSGGPQLKWSGLSLQFLMDIFS